MPGTLIAGARASAASRLPLPVFLAPLPYTSRYATVFPVALMGLMTILWSVYCFVLLKLPDPLAGTSCLHAPNLFV
jgi:hypothetical protein